MNADAKKRYKDIPFPFTCPINNRKFESSKGLSCYVTKTLKANHEDYYKKFINHRDINCFFCGNIGKFISISKGYRNLCNGKECMVKSFNSHSVDGFMYRNMCSREHAEILFNIENKRQLEERINTQNELRKIDKDWDRKRSRNCKEFWINKGYNEEDAIVKSKEVMCEIHEKTSKILKSNPIKYANKYPTKVEYYTTKGMSEDDAKLEISKIQNRFSLDICIDKYGRENGRDIFIKRQEKWLNTLDSKTDEEKMEINKKKISGAQYSPISQKLFWEIYNICGNTKTKFGEFGKEFVLINDSKNCFAYDYVDIEKKKCIEFNGDFWHCNPIKFCPNDIHRVKNKKASDIWENDKNKLDLINSKGYDVLVIWESEYRKCPQQTLQKCIEFING
jgi:hypothetical protein